MSKEYEVVVIFQSGEEGVSKGKETMASEFENFQITIQKEEDKGERMLAYEIAEQDRGHYYLYEIESDPQSVNQISKSLKLRSEILKFLFVNKKTHN